MVNCAAVIWTSKGKIGAARICLNAVYVKPYCAVKAEAYLIGREINEENAEEGGAEAVSDAKPMKDNGYMVQIAKTMVKWVVLACG
jgi:xanthine dehydrogenase YagS FAD-binding subunit